MISSCIVYKLVLVDEYLCPQLLEYTDVVSSHSAEDFIDYLDHRDSNSCGQQIIRPLVMSLPAPTHTIVDRTAETVNELKDPIDDLMDNLPGNANVSKAFLSWLVKVLILLLQFIQSIALDYGHRLVAIERKLSTTTASTTAPASTDAAAATTSKTTAQHSKHCQKCHACGHDAIDCRTANPSAMRKRVASNGRLAREARIYSASTQLPPTMPSVVQPYPYYPMPTTPIPHYANLVADATELRRCAAQSARDKRSKNR